MQFGRRGALAGLAALPFAASVRAAPGPITVFEAARFITMEPAQPTARFVAVADGMVLGLADTLAELSAWTSGREVRLDRSLAGSVVLPGLIEPHLHPMQAAVMLNIPFAAPDDWSLPGGTFPGTRSPEAWRARVNELLQASRADPFICWGYHELFHGPLDRQTLDALSPDRPVIIWQRSFHEVIVNTAALKVWKLANQASFAEALRAVKADPAHGSLERGLFSETALPAAMARLQPVILAPERIGKGMADLRRLLLDHGITTASDMATGIFAGFDTEAALIRAAFERADNPSRIMLMPMAATIADGTDPVAYVQAQTSRFAGPHVRMDRRVKLLADGAFFAQNMRMGPPGYSDGHEGKWLTPPDVLNAQLRRYWDAGFSLHIHVNGDEGLDVVLGGIEMLPVRRAQTITLEHLGYSTEAQNRRIARLGLMVSAQPNYIRVLGDAYAAHGLGPDRAAAINRLGSLERLGVPLGLHSDFNMAPIDPLYLAWIAANRVTIEGRTKDPAERLSLGKALRAITIEAAEVIGMDHLVGSIATGKRADFAVLDRDPFKAGAAALRNVGVRGVVFEGRFYAR